MGLLSKISTGLKKSFVRDWDHGGFVNVNWPWNYWQEDRSVRYGPNNVVYSCVQTYAQTVAQLPARHIRIRSDGSPEVIDNSRPSRILQNPNSYQTTSDFFLNLVYGLLYHGNAYGLSVGDSIHLVPPASTQAIVFEGDVFYHVSPPEVSGSGAMMAPARDVLHVKLTTLNDPLKGETPIYAAATAIDVNNAVMAQQATFLRNMSRPSGVLSTDEKLTAEQAEDLRKRWNEHSKGLNSGGVPILSYGLKWFPMSLNTTDAEIIEVLKMSIKDIARAYGIPMPLIGEEEGATYNNVYNLLSFWKAKGLGFVIEHLEQALTRFFRLPANEKIELEVDRLMRLDMKTRIDALTAGITGGLYAPDEARRKEGLPPVDGGDMPRVQQQMVPLDAAFGEPVPEITDDQARSANIASIKEALRCMD